MRESETNKNNYGLEGFCSRRTALISGRMLKALTHIQQSFTSVLSWCEPTTCTVPHRLNGATAREEKLLSSALSLRGYRRCRYLLSGRLLSTSASLSHEPVFTSSLHLFCHLPLCPSPPLVCVRRYTLTLSSLPSAVCLSHSHLPNITNLTRRGEGRDGQRGNRWREERTGEHKNEEMKEW